MTELTPQGSEPEEQDRTRLQKRQLWLIVLVMVGSSCLGVLVIFGITLLLRNNLIPR
jgi:hypothetical protein